MAAAILIDGGLRSLTMERLAERAGVSKGLGYAYFKDVEDVALALWEREISGVYRHIEEATAGSPSLDSLVGRAVKAYFDIITERGNLLGLLQSQLSQGRLERQIQLRVRDFLRFWRRQLAAFLPLDQTTATAMAVMTPAAVDACARLWSVGGISRADAERLAQAFVLDGVRAVGSEERPAARS